MIEGITTINVHASDIGPAAQQEPHDIDAMVPSGIKERRFAIGCRRVDVRAGIKERGGLSAIVAMVQRRIVPRARRGRRRLTGSPHVRAARYKLFNQTCLIYVYEMKSVERRGNISRAALFNANVMSRFSDDNQSLRGSTAFKRIKSITTSMGTSVTASIVSSTQLAGAAPRRLSTGGSAMTPQNFSSRLTASALRTASVE